MFVLLEPLCRGVTKKGQSDSPAKEAAGGPRSPRLGSYPVMEAGRRGPSVAERVARPEVDLSRNYFSTGDAPATRAQPIGKGTTTDRRRTQKQRRPFKGRGHSQRPELLALGPACSTPWPPGEAAGIRLPPPYPSLSGPGPSPGSSPAAPSAAL